MKENIFDDVDIKVWLIHKHEHHHKIEGKSDFFHRSLRIASYWCLMMMARWRLNDIFTCFFRERPREKKKILWFDEQKRKKEKSSSRDELEVFVKNFCHVCCLASKQLKQEFKELLRLKIGMQRLQFDFFASEVSGKTSISAITRSSNFF